jgi:hypothetical protein
MPKDWISWKPGVNRIADFGIEYEKAAVVNVVEKKDIKKFGLKIPVIYYPGIIVTIPMPRSAI